MFIRSVSIDDVTVFTRVYSKSTAYIIIIELLISNRVLNTTIPGQDGKRYR